MRAKHWIVVFSCLCAGFAVLASPSIVLAETGEMRPTCGGPNTTRDEWITGCSALIDSGTVTGRARAVVAYAQRGFAFTLKRNLDQAEKDLDQAVKIDPTFAQAFVNRANFWTVSGKPDRALADSEQAIRLDPQFPLAYFTHGGAALNLGQYDRAIADYSEVLRLRPNSGAFIYGPRGRAYHLKGDDDRAIADYDQQLKLEPNDAGTLLNRGDALRNKNDFSRAGADYSEAIRLAPDEAGGWKGRGFIRLATQDFKGAIADFDEAIRRNPNEGGVYLNRGDAWSMLKENERARGLQQGNRTRTEPPVGLRQPRADIERHGQQACGHCLDRQGPATRAGILAGSRNVEEDRRGER
jgi:tetratricopeptide (TPR) repeat protein